MEIIIVWENKTDAVELRYEDDGYWYFVFKNGHKMNSCTVEQALDIIHFVELGVSK